MGANSRYFITTREMEEQEFFNYKKQMPFIDNWKVEPQDKELFKNDDNYNYLLNKYLKAKKELDKYKFDKRHK